MDLQHLTTNGQGEGPSTSPIREHKERSTDMAELDMSWVTEEQVVPDDYKETRDFEHFEI